MKTEKNYLRRFTDEQIRQANSVNLIDLAKQYGFELEDKERNAYHAKKSGGLYFFKNQNTFHHFGTDEKGAAINFIMMMEKISFVDSVKKLLGNDYIPLQTEYSAHKPKNETKQNEDLILPDKADNYKRVYWYLLNIRGIEQEIVSKLMNEKKIYQQAKNGNCVFVGYDEDNQAKYCSKRGTNPDKPFKGDASNSDKSYPFHITGQSRTVYVLESPIDCMSHASLTKLHGLDWKKDHRISLGCLSDAALDNFLKWYDIEKIIFALDDDTEGKLVDGTPYNWGQEASKRFALKYHAMGYQVAIQTPICKDFNEDLINFKEMQKLEREEETEMEVAL